ncbi:MAG TPA: AmmeMemoRadiSam system protein B [Methanobacterium subterraneum]|uniref:MEMO1 family protein HA271_05350 n=1 Tax=Methanobacterium subterraneum TaxID=59277 RepID=A0A7J4TIJ2_9EURY|nr:AmmeMemoRadiSam system protein B [Methanobacterium subterraneum]
MIRKPAVAGMFYESDEGSLKKRIEWCYQHKLGPGKQPGKLGNQRSIKGLIAPHAGYVYSGPVAACSYLELAEDGMPETVVILCPNHTGMGSGLATMTQGSWLTPLGEVEIDQEFATELVNYYPLLDDDPSAHIQEHSCEVQLPFLQEISTDFQMVPVCMMMQDVETSRELGETIAHTAAKLGRDTVVIASTDFTHYQPQEVAQAHDEKVLQAIAKMDEVEMIQRIQEYQVTMCGYGPVTATIEASRNMGAQTASILQYATSGDTGGDKDSVVGYASAVFR